MKNTNKSVSFNLPLKILFMFLLVYILRDISSLGLLYGEARGPLNIPRSEVYDLFKHLREALFLKYYIGLILFDLIMVFAFLGKNRAFIWMMLLYFLQSLSMPVLHAFLFHHQYGDLMDQAAIHTLLARTIGSALASLLLVFPWVVYLLRSVYCRNVFSKKERQQTKVSEW